MNLRQLRLLRRFKKNEYVIIGAALIVLTIGLAVLLASPGKKDAPSGGKTGKTTIQFDLEMINVDENVMNSFKQTVNKNATYGVSYMDECVIKKVYAEPYTRAMPDVEQGVFVMSAIPGKYRVVVTFEAEVYENDHEFKGDYELIVAGKQLACHTKGAAFWGYVVAIRVVKGGDGA